jgi:outer membrane protein TolC
VVEVDDAVGDARTAFERVDATRKAREYAEAALDAEQKKLESGKSTSFFVLEFQNQLTAARLAEIRALADYSIALSQLALVEGTTLEKNQIDLTLE